MNRKILILSLIATAILVLALAADEGARDYQSRKNREKGTNDSPVSLYEKPDIKIDPKAIDQKLTDSITSKQSPAPAPKPLVSAEAYLVGDLETGKIYLEHNSSKVFPIASLSKLITALVTTHMVSSDKKVTITKEMLEAYGEAGHLVEGETLTTSELIYPLLLESSNDAAEALAQSYGYDEFIKQMNSFALAHGMKSTSFKDSSGISPGNMSNAKDLFTLAQYLYSSEKPLLSITRQTQFTLASTTEHGEHIWNTINPFPLDPHFIGGKTGRTDEAKESMVSLFNFTQGLHTYPLAIVVLRSDFKVREIDSSSLFIQAMHKIESQ